MFVHPEPAFGVGADGFLEMIPHALGQSLGVVAGLRAEGFENLHLVGAIGGGLADAGDQGKAG